MADPYKDISLRGGIAAILSGIRTEKARIAELDRLDEENKLERDKLKLKRREAELKSQKGQTVSPGAGVIRPGEDKPFFTQPFKPEALQLSTDPRSGQRTIFDPGGGGTAPGGGYPRPETAGPTFRTGEGVFQPRIGQEGVRNVPVGSLLPGEQAAGQDLQIKQRKALRDEMTFFMKNWSKVLPQSLQILDYGKFIAELEKDPTLFAKVSSNIEKALDDALAGKSRGVSPADAVAAKHQWDTLKARNREFFGEMDLAGTINTRIQSSTPGRLPSGFTPKSTLTRDKVLGVKRVIDEMRTGGMGELEIAQELFMDGLNPREWGFR